MAWFISWALGLPAPHVDDLFFTGTAVNLSAGGRLANPWIHDWLLQFGSDAFWAQPPVHPYWMAVWLKLFGVGTKSLLGFQNLAGALLCLGGALLVRRLGGSRLGAAAVWLSLAHFVHGIGLRPDAWAAALLVGGVWLQLRPSAGFWSLGCGVIALAVAMHPFALVFAIPATAASFWTRITAPPRRPQTASVCGGAAAIVAAILLVAWLLDFRLREFMAAFQLHARMRTPPPAECFAHFWAALTVGWEMILRLPLIGVTALGLVLPSTAPRTVRLGIAITFGMVALGLATYAGYTPVWLNPFLAGVAAVLWNRLASERGRRMGRAALLCAIVWSVAPMLLQLATARSESPSHYSSIRAEIQRHPHDRLLIDEVAARYVFDFQLPPGTQNWLVTRRTIPGELPSPLALKPRGELWVVSEPKFEQLVPDSPIRAEHFEFGGRVFGTLLVHPWRLEAVP